jgi:hypothetical protein
LIQIHESFSKILFREYPKPWFEIIQIHLKSNLCSSQKFENHFLFLSINWAQSSLAAHHHFSFSWIFLNQPHWPIGPVGLAKAHGSSSSFNRLGWRHRCPQGHTPPPLASRWPPPLHSRASVVRTTPLPLSN